MAVNLQTLTQLCLENACVARIVVLSVKGSTPRDSGAEMFVWDTGQSGTIGGGELEFQAIKNARLGMAARVSRMSSHPLGPQLGQCCGGYVKLLTEYFEWGQHPIWSQSQMYVRPVNVQGEMPLSISRLIRRVRSGQELIEPAFLDDWVVEKISKPTRELWIWGAGHVGQAIVDIMSPLPDISIYWVDTHQDRFPCDLPKNVTQVVAHLPSEMVKHSPSNAEHLILTYSHSFDFSICNELLNHGFKRAGLIGSDTKWARFRSRLNALGHAFSKIDQIACPIGQKSLGKHPQQIAIGVAQNWLDTEINKNREQKHDQKLA